MKKRDASFLKSNNKFSFKKRDKKAKNLPASYLLKLSKRSFLFRSWLIFFVITALLGAVYFHIFVLQVYENKKYELSSNNNYIKIIPKPPARGIITDRNGIGLALNKQEYGVYILPVSNRKARQDFEKLQQIIPLTEDDYSKFLTNKRNNLFRAPTLLKSNLSQEEIAKIMVNKYRLDDISIEPIYTRYYPFGTALPHILGYVGSINSRDNEYIRSLDEQARANYTGSTQIGKIGIEKSYETQLLGTVGYDSVEVNSTGNILKTIDTKEPISGNNLRLSIDLPLQIYAQSLLKEQKGAIVVSDPRTSEILALVSMPVYDANLFVGGISSTNYNELLYDHDKPLYNRATMGVYPPGSTIKPFFAFTGLESGFITSNTTIWDPGYWILPRTNQRYRDWLRTGHGRVDLHKAIVESVDTYFYDLAYRMGIDRMASYMTQFGFGSKTGIDIGEESSANYPTEAWKMQRFKRPWVLGDTPPVGIGQGYFSATPIQLVHALNIFLNRGKVTSPYLVLDQVKNNADHSTSIFPTLTNSSYIFTDARASYWNDVLKGMYGVNHERGGSGLAAFAGTNYSSGGKSGTAQVFSLNGGNYRAQDLNKALHDHALYIAFAPYDNPEVSVAMVVENGGGGGRVAGPIARQVLDYYINTRLPHLNKELSCSQVQNYAIADLEALGVQVNLNDVYQLQQLSQPGQACQVEKQE
ncbi:penicillin-binding protein 2 [Psittacicella melopsittaci]|uniref:Penicillin-binding protein 2 n=1 Tax=Psittacicella melopsittaci TaxID=2028576 RepID=A0A3A1Y7N4_9GAMM|nr:penicillin-binding protein 2 [Psittacicella melopsittaci]RIY33249.1 penicillin-binding protein 2 [Psittacicella melopsittaci]